MLEFNVVNFITVAIIAILAILAVRFITKSLGAASPV